MLGRILQCNQPVAFFFLFFSNEIVSLRVIHHRSVSSYRTAPGCALDKARKQKEIISAGSDLLLLIFAVLSTGGDVDIVSMQGNETHHDAERCCSDPKFPKDLAVEPRVW